MRQIQSFLQICQSRNWRKTLWNTRRFTRVRPYIFSTLYCQHIVCVKKKNSLTHLNWISKISFAFFLALFALQFAVKNKTQNQFVQTIFITKTKRKKTTSRWGVYYKLNKFAWWCVRNWMNIWVYVKHQTKGIIKKKFVKLQEFQMNVETFFVVFRQMPNY